MATADEKTLDTALKRFKFGTDAESSQRQRELAGLRFYAGDQWPDYVKIAREGGDIPGSSGMATAKKPCLTINKVKQPVQQIVNQEKNANLGILLRAETEASVQDAKIRQGLIRHIQAHSRARLARSWAYERSAQVGRGYYRIDKDYIHKTKQVLDPTTDPASLLDQELIVSRILNQGNVLLDPFAKQPDWSDGNWAFVWDDMPWDEFKRKYKGTKTAKLLDTNDDKELTAVAETSPGWIGTEEESRTVRVAEYWYASYSPVTVRTRRLPDGSTDLTDQAVEDWPEGAKAVGGELEIEDRQIHCCKITVRDVLEEADWEGRHIPIIPTIGNEYNLNGQRLWNGEIEDAQDAQRLFNYTASAIALATALAPLAPFILDPAQIEGYEGRWNNANTIAFPYLPRRSLNDQGQPFPDVSRQGSEPPIQALALMLNQADSYIQATTSTPDTSLGRFDPKKASGKAVGLLQQQSDLANSNYLDNLAHISMSLEGTILNEMLPYVYDRPGRIVQILGDQQEAQPVMLNQPFQRGQNGQPQPVDPNQPQPANLEHYDLSKGTFSVVVDVIKSEPTQRKETQQNIIDMMGTSPQVSSALAPYLFKYSDQAGSEEMFATLSKLLWPPDFNLKPGQVSPQQMQQAAQQIQQLSQIVHQQQQQIESKQVEIQTQGQIDIELAKIKAVTDIRKAQIAAVSAGQVAETKVNAELATTVFEQEVAASGMQMDHAHEAIQSQLDRRHDADQQAQQQAHDASQQDQQQLHEQSLAQQQAAQQEADRQAATQEQP